MINLVRLFFALQKYSFLVNLFEEKDLHLKNNELFYWGNVCFGIVCGANDGFKN